MTLKYCTSVPAREKPGKEPDGFFNTKEEQITDESKVFFFFVCFLVGFSIH